jgi:hypothetical protein
VQTYYPADVATPHGDEIERAGSHTLPIGVAWFGLGAAMVGGAVLVSLSPIAAFAFVIACAVFIGLASAPVATAMLVVALVPITSGVQRGFPIPGLRISETLVVGAAVIVLMRPTQADRARWTSMDWAVLAYTVGGPLLEVLDMVVSRRHLTLSSLQTAAGPVQFLLLYRVVAVTMRDERSQRLAQRLLLLASVPVSVLAVLEALGPPAIHTALVRVTGTTVFTTNGFTAVPRAASVFPIWLGLAGYLLVIMVLGSSLLLAGVRDVLPRWALIAVLLLGFAALVASLTITIMVALVIGVVYLGWRNQRLLPVLGAAVIAAVIAGLVFGSLLLRRLAAQQQSGHQTGNQYLPQTIEYRVQIWRDQYLPALSGHWATGYGPTYPPNISWAHTESGYITLLLRGGVPYLAITAVLIWFVVAKARKDSAATRSPSRRALCEATAVLALLLIVINLTFPYLTDGGMPQPLWVVFGLLGAGELRRSAPRSVRTQLAGHQKEVSVI